MNKDIKKLVSDFLKKYSLKKINYISLKDVVEKLGYTVIEYNRIVNDKDVEVIISNLNVGDAIVQSRGFTYADKDYRIVFVNEDLNEEEKLIVISHELGHIVCGHSTTNAIIGKDVTQEYEANEFSHYLINPCWFFKVKSFVRTHKLITISSIVAVFLIIAVVCVVNHITEEKKYHDGDYYRTPTGSKYHRADCIHIKDSKNAIRLTKEEYESGQYEACANCLPDDD